MNPLSPTRLAVPLVAIVVIGPMALAQETGQQAQTDRMAGQGMRGQTTQQQPMDGCPMMSRETMGGPMMGRMMGQGRQGMMGQRMMGRGMSQSGGTVSGMAAVFGSRVAPMMNLSAEDVRAHLAVQLDRLNNKRLKLGDIKADTGTITAEIVTVDNSLVQRLQVDRRTGAIDYQE